MSTNTKALPAADLTIGGLFSVAAATSTGLMSVELVGISMQRVLYELGPAGVTISVAFAIFALMFKTLFERPSFDDQGPETFVLLALTGGIILMGMVSPGWADGSIVAGVIAVGISAGGYWSLGS